MNYDIAVIGGGHIGAPLAILFASKGLKVIIYDINKQSIDTMASGKLPFLETGYEPFIKKALADNNLHFTTEPDSIKNAKTIIITIGTDVDYHGNAKIKDITKCIDSLPIHNDHLIILRSTISPGVSKYVKRHLASKKLYPEIAFCPERITQGNFFTEISNIPQIVSGMTDAAVEKASNLFKLITDKIVVMKPLEAEFGKLFSNVYRYIQFAASNNFYELATAAGADYNKILEGIKQDYPRLRDLPSAGFANGPCLGKDAQQLSAYANGKFALGQAAMQVNEGLPGFLVSELEKRYDLTKKTVGILGMAFKAENDDIRASLSYKLKKILLFRAESCLTTDPFVLTSIDPELSPLELVLELSDIIIVAVPHKQYKNIKELTKAEIINVWKS